MAGHIPVQVLREMEEPTLVAKAGGSQCSRCLQLLLRVWTHRYQDATGQGVHAWGCCHFLQCRCKTTLWATSSNQTKKRLKTCGMVGGARAHLLLFLLLQWQPGGVMPPACDNHFFLLLEKNVCVYVLILSATS